MEQSRRERFEDALPALVTFDQHAYNQYAGEYTAESLAARLRVLAKSSVGELFANELGRVGYGIDQLDNIAALEVNPQTVQDIATAVADVLMNNVESREELQKEIRTIAAAIAVL